MKFHRMTAIATASLVVASSPAMATQGGNSVYVIGAQTINPGTLREGSTMQSFSVYYKSSDFEDSKGDARFKDFSTEVEVQAFRFQYVLPEQYTPGFRVGFAMLAPFFHIDTTRQPFKGPTVHGKDTGLSDPLFTPLMIGNSFDMPILGHVNQAFRFTVNLPVGNYDESKPINVGHHYWALLPSYGIDAHPDDKTTLGLNFTYIHNNPNLDDGYRSGQETVTEFVGMRKVADDLSLGLNGYFYKQITGDVQQDGTRFNGDGFYGRALGIGPQLQYEVNQSIGATLKWQHEMMVRDRPRGDRLWLQLSFRL
jgi:hypothetical protein